MFSCRFIEEVFVLACCIALKQVGLSGCMLIAAIISQTHQLPGINLPRNFSFQLEAVCLKDAILSELPFSLQLHATE